MDFYIFNFYIYNNLSDGQHKSYPMCAFDVYINSLILYLQWVCISSIVKLMLYFWALWVQMVDKSLMCKSEPSV